MNLDTSTWEEFKVGDLFTVELAKGDIKLNEMDSGNVALVSSGETNNGIVGYIHSDGDGKSEIFPPNRITLDMFGNAFYQSEKFYAVSHGRVNILNPKFEMTKAVGVFLASVIKQEKYKYSYGRAVYSNVAENMVIKLPIKHNADGSPYIDKTYKYSEDGYIPDWQFMENYIKSLHHKPLTTKNKAGNTPTLEVGSWREFELGKLFKVTKAHAYNQETFEPVTDSSVDTIGCITRTAVNNGLDYYGELTSDLEVEEGNALTIGGEGVVCFYQPKEFVCGTNMTVLRHEQLNQYNGLFISRIIDYYSHNRFSYGRAFNKGQIEKSIIKLPATPEGTPDWQYMENYIKALPYGDRL